MDIFAHTLWANAGARALNTIAEGKNKKFHITPLDTLSIFVIMKTYEKCCPKFNFNCSSL